MEDGERRIEQACLPSFPVAPAKHQRRRSGFSFSGFLFPAADSHNLQPRRRHEVRKHPCAPLPALSPGPAPAAPVAPREPRCSACARACDAAALPPQLAVRWAVCRTSRSGWLWTQRIRCGFFGRRAASDWMKGSLSSPRPVQDSWNLFTVVLKDQARFPRDSPRPLAWAGPRIKGMLPLTHNLKLGSVGSAQHNLEHKFKCCAWIGPRDEIKAR